MKRSRKLLVVAAVVGLAATAPAVYAVADDEDPGASPRAKAPETYADYSLMTEKHAGSVVGADSGDVVTQWAWKPMDGGAAEIQWGNPKEGWPPKSGEHFEKDGDWVYMTGYYDHERDMFNKQEVTEEFVGDADCQNMKPLETDGRQHYTKWEIPAEGYCLRAKGTITVEANGAVVNFEHEQRWSPPKPCENSHLGQQTCIVQHETWSDDNKHEFKKVLERDQYLAKGLGMAFRIDASFPEDWHAEMKDSWTY
ncbi:MAG: hypothetical protein ACRD0P_04920 [Stackebrandtia sp.]